jgi:hypothetical protein
MAVTVPIPRAAASMVAVVVAISGGVRCGEQRVLPPKEANFLFRRCGGKEGGRGRGGDVDLYGLALLVNAEVVYHGLNSFPKVMSGSALRWAMVRRSEWTPTL